MKKVVTTQIKNVKSIKWDVGAAKKVPIQADYKIELNVIKRNQCAQTLTHLFKLATFSSIFSEHFLTFRLKRIKMRDVDAITNNKDKQKS